MSATLPIDGRDQVRLYVWDPVVRLTHWVVAFSILILALTGIYLGSPFFLVPGEAGDHFVTGTIKVIHFGASIPFTLAVITRIVWMFTASSPVASWRQLVPSSMARLRALAGMLSFYSLVKREPDPEPGHNPMAGGGYLMAFCLYLLMIVTGLAVYGADADARSWMHGFSSVLPWIGGAQFARYLHHIGMWGLLLFFVVHVYFAILGTTSEKNGAIDSIITGYKWFRRSSVER